MNFCGMLTLKSRSLQSYWKSLYSSITWLLIQLQCNLWTCYQISTGECEITVKTLSDFSSFINCSLKTFSSNTSGGSNSNILNFFQNNWKPLYAVGENSLTHMSQNRFEILSLENTVLTQSEIYLNIFFVRNNLLFLKF